MGHGHTVWVPEHLIGGHPALDLANAIFDRRVPTPKQELLTSARDVGNWLRAAGLADDLQAGAVANVADAAFVEGVREIREASFSVFEAVVAGSLIPAEALSFLFLRAASGLGVDSVDPRTTRPNLTLSHWRDPVAVTAFLAMLTIEAFFTLPRERLRSCPRCGWLFVDTSRGGRRRWCSMRTCGNREKALRHRDHAEVRSTRPAS